MIVGWRVLEVRSFRIAATDLPDTSFVAVPFLSFVQLPMRS